MIVPRSTQLIAQDSEYGLFTVTLFKKVIDEFKLHAREKKFIVRDFTYNEEELAAGLLKQPSLTARVHVERYIYINLNFIRVGETVFAYNFSL